MRSVEKGMGRKDSDIKQKIELVITLFESKAKERKIELVLRK